MFGWKRDSIWPSVHKMLSSLSFQFDVILHILLSLTFLFEFICIWNFSLISLHVRLVLTYSIRTCILPCVCWGCFHRFYVLVSVNYNLMFVWCLSNLLPVTRCCQNKYQFIQTSCRYAGKSYYGVIDRVNIKNIIQVV